MSLCENQFNYFKESFERKEAWALKFFDTWGNTFHGGLLHNVTRSLGLFEECVKFRHETNELRGQYCLLEFKYDESQEGSLESQFDWGRGAQTVIEQTRGAFYSGVCLPASCQAGEELGIATSLLSGSRLKLIDVFCQTDDRVPLNFIDCCVLLLLGVLLLLAIAGTLFDILNTRHKDENRKHHIMTSFSLRRNWKSLTNINPPKNSVACLNGLKVLSAFWIIIGHRRLRVPQMSHQFSRDHLPDVYFDFLGYPVDVFFLAAGFLVAQACFKAFQNESFHYFKLCFNRYMRYAPSVAMLIILYASSLTNLIAYGPIADKVLDDQVICRQFWWKTVLAIHNFSSENVCLRHLWYLGADFQLFLISPPIAYFLIKFQKKAVITLTALIIIDHIIIFCFLFWKLFSYYQLYHQTQYKIGPWMIGMMLAYVMQNVDNELSQKKLIGGWIIALASLVTDTITVHLQVDFHDATRDIFWSLFIAWIVFACHHLNSGGFIGRFLGHCFWLPLSRLCLGIYLIHYVYIQLSVANMKQLSHVDMHWLIHIGFGDVVVSIFLATLMYLMIEAPIANLVSHCQDAISMISNWRLRFFQQTFNY